MDALKDFLHLASPIATLIGLGISTWGSYRLMLFYHPFRGTNFWKSLRRLMFLTMTFRFKTLRQKIRVEAQLGKHKEEKRADSLTGVYLLFFGFALQVFGAICWCFDSWMDIAFKP
jgi:hypothetical protein